MKQITPAQHLAFTYKALADGVKIFAKPGEEQDKAIKRFMSQLRTRTAKALPRKFPQFKPGMTTAEYVKQFDSLNVLTHGGHADHLTNPAPVNEGPEVIFETEEDECLDLI